LRWSRSARCERSVLVERRRRREASVDRFRVELTERSSPLRRFVERRSLPSTPEVLSRHRADTLCSNWSAREPGTTLDDPVRFFRQPADPERNRGPVEPEQDEEGWFTDPYRRHEARWLSYGKPTKLVRDGGVESYDDPPDEEPVQEPVRVEEPVEATGGSDLLRAGEHSGSGDLTSLTEAMEDAALEGGAHPQIDLP